MDGKICGVNDGSSYESEGSGSTSGNYNPVSTLADRGIIYQSSNGKICVIGVEPSHETKESASDSISGHHRDTDSESESTDRGTGIPHAHHLGWQQEGGAGSQLGSTSTHISRWINTTQESLYRS